MSKNNEDYDLEEPQPISAPAPSMSVMLSRDAILSASDIVTELVEIPEWGGSLYVRSMTGRERDEFEESILVEKRQRTRSGSVRMTRQASLANFRAKLVARVCFDSNGNRLFSDDDAARLGEKNSSALQRIVKKAQELSGMTDEDVDELVDELGEDQG